MNNNSKKEEATWSTWRIRRGLSEKMKKTKETTRTKMNFQSF